MLDKTLIMFNFFIFSTKPFCVPVPPSVNSHTCCSSLPPPPSSFQHYRGVQVAYVSPLELASYDVVLVTYETLREELNYANSHEGPLHIM